ncbi:MAG: VOC family protein [Ferruginibacter sp.]
MEQLIAGIQQVGIGVSNADEAKLYYRDLFGMNTKVFDDEAEASLMTKYTGGETYRRRAILSMNLSGGGGFEIWQFLNRCPLQKKSKLLPGDTGIIATKIKTADIYRAHAIVSKSPVASISTIFISPDNRRHFWIEDNFGNWFNIIECSSWFKLTGSHFGGVAGAVIGVSNLKSAYEFYSNILGIDEKVYEQKVNEDEFPFYDTDGKTNFTRLLLRKKCGERGAFSKLLGDFEIELVQSDSKLGSHIYANRFWGDCGFIHLCFDVTDMEALKLKCQNAGLHFSVDSNDSFQMGQAAGRFCYIEDPEGTLIELVETHKVPISKKMGLYIDLKKRKQNKPLPAWMVKLLGLSKIK